jgi:hypothetical protein
MNPQAQIQKRLHQLMAQESLAASQCGRAFLSLVEPLLQGGVLELQPSGAGQILSVKNAAALRDFCRQRFPEAAWPADSGGRVESVARFRDTKALASRENEIISLRSWREDALWREDRPAGAAAATAAHGVFSFLLAPDSPYELRGAVALVENPAVFLAAEQLKPGVDLVIYGQGRISHRVLDWLTRSKAPGFHLLHLPDYDPVGLSEFQRLHAHLGDRVSLHLPADLEARFAQYSNRELLKKGNSQALLAQLRQSTLPAIRRVVELMDRHNAGLEQEALLIHLAPSLNP